MQLLTINTGSSSLKTAVYDTTPRLSPRLTVEIGSIGQEDASMRVRDASGAVLLDHTQPLPGHGEALRAILSWLRERGLTQEIAAIGHRVVHGGPIYSAPVPITAEVVETLRSLVSIDPQHLPQAIEAIETTGALFPGIPQVACFDTAFHRTMPEVAQAYPLPPEITASGVIRYGFHGLSYEYIVSALRDIDGPAAGGRAVIAHLGNGASMAAVRDGIGVDTTMGFTPTGGLMMGTRTGDLDPGVLLYLFQSRGMTADEVNRLVNARSGLLGVSQVSPDMQRVLEAAESDPRAALAIDLFCYTAKKYLGALIAVLGGIDTLVFTAGIGEHAPSIRACICEGLECLGLVLDPERNAASEPIVSREEAPAVVRVVHTDEDLVIARHTLQLQNEGDRHVRV